MAAVDNLIETTAVISRSLPARLASSHGTNAIATSRVSQVSQAKWHFFLQPIILISGFLYFSNKREICL